MTPDELERRIRATGFPDTDRLIEMCQEDQTMFKLVAGSAIFDKSTLSPKINKWVHDGNIGKVTALGLFVGFLRQRASDPDFTEIWTKFLSLEAEEKQEVCRNAWEHLKERRSGVGYGKEDDELFLERLSNADFVDGLRNPKYLIYKSSRQLLTMLKRDGKHRKWYYMERTLTEFFFPDEVVTL